MSVNGQVLFDARGRVSSQAQSGFSTAATTSFVASGNTSNPTLFTYDVLGRHTSVNVPDGTSQGIVTTTAYRIIHASACWRQPGRRRYVDRHEGQGRDRESASGCEVSGTFPGWAACRKRPIR